MPSLCVSLRVFDAGELALFTCSDDIKSIEMKDSGNRDFAQDGLLNEDSNQLTNLSTSLSTLDASTSSSENPVGSPSGLLLATLMASTKNPHPKMLKELKSPQIMRPFSERECCNQNEENKMDNTKYSTTARA